MENVWVIGVLVVLGMYYLTKFFGRDSGKVVKDYSSVESSYSDIINDDKYQIKGQWEK